MNDPIQTHLQQRKHAQLLRKNMTKEERHLWYDFLKTYPVQFRRQYPIRSYIVDFYCEKAKLIIELDGSQHYNPATQSYDKQRTAQLEQDGFFVLRFSNADVMRRFRGVCQTIQLAVKNRMQG